MLCAGIAIPLSVGAHWVIRRQRDSYASESVRFTRNRNVRLLCAGYLVKLSFFLVSTVLNVFYRTSCYEWSQTVVSRCRLELSSDGIQRGIYL